MTTDQVRDRALDNLPHLVAAILLNIALFAGCGGDRAQGNFARELPQDQPAQNKAAGDVQVAHPEYANWSKFPVGTAVVRKKRVTDGERVVQVTTTIRLVENTPKRVAVESQISVIREGQQPIENPPTRTEFPATFPLPPGMTVEQFMLPSLKARQISEETRQVSEREYHALVFAWEEVNETGPMRIKLWRSSSMPGRFLRQEVTGHMHDSVEQVVEILQPR